ncbi:MAG: outer membrane lipoprotein-sorting protein [Trueperaceae bacterium]|nr:MAG: outer membrane lipoprotein-sorting protein [Trueperaceae bacterium]
MKRLSIVLATFLASFGLAQMYNTADEVMDAMDAQASPDTSITTTTMKITSGSGQTLSRQMQTWSLGEEKQNIKFTAPPDIEGSGFLTIEQSDGSEESLLWLPALGRVRRIATSGDDQDGSFFGSDFTYEDIGGIEREEWESVLLEIRDGPLYIVEVTPKEATSTQYERIVYEIPEAELIPTRSEFYKAGELFKIMTISEIAEVGGYRIPAAMKMETVGTGSFTEIQQSGYTVDEPIPDEVFSERFLRR